MSILPRRNTAWIGFTNMALTRTFLEHVADPYNVNRGQSWLHATAGDSNCTFKSLQSHSQVQEFFTVIGSMYLDLG